MAITPLPQFEKDLAEYLQEKADREAYEHLRPPTSIVVRFGRMKMIGEFPYDGEAKPGCGSKIVIRSHRGTEVGEMLTSTCPNAGCSKSVTRKQMLEYIQNSGGRDYPFFEQGRVLRIATAEDVNQQAALEQQSHARKLDARERARRLGMNMKIIDVEPILGGEMLTFFFTAEGRVDFRELVRELAAEHHTRIEMRQVGARDEARITADYERCGQYCCCKNFLKVLKPVSMRSAKTQKATLDPLKISGRCGRLMCCLRYEDQTYRDLEKRLPRRGAKVGTPEGDGVVVDSQILTQLVRVRLDAGEEGAWAVEELTEPGQESERSPAGPGASAPSRTTEKPKRRGKPKSSSQSTAGEEQPARPKDTPAEDARPTDAQDEQLGAAKKPRKSRRRGRRKKRGDQRGGDQG